MAPQPTGTHAEDAANNPGQNALFGFHPGPDQNTAFWALHFYPIRSEFHSGVLAISTRHPAFACCFHILVRILKKNMHSYTLFRMDSTGIEILTV